MVVRLRHLQTDSAEKGGAERDVWGDPGQADKQGVLLVANEGAWASGVIRASAQLGAAVVQAGSLRHARALASRAGRSFFDVAAVGVRLPDGSGVELAQELARREVASSTLIGGEGLGPAEELELNASEVLVFAPSRPMGELQGILQVLLERADALRARRLSNSQDDQVPCGAVCARCPARCLGSFCIDAETRRIVGADAVVRLTPSQWRVLDTLSEAEGAPMSWEALASGALRRGDAGAKGSLAVALHRLRKCLLDAGVRQPLSVVTMEDGMVSLQRGRDDVTVRRASSVSGVHPGLGQSGVCPRRARLEGEASAARRATQNRHRQKM